MRDTAISLKIVRDWNNALLAAYIHVVNGFEAATPHDQLLLEHAIAACRMLRANKERDSTKCKIKFNAPESVAYIQWWTTVQLQVGSLEHFVVNHILAEIDQHSKSRRVHRLE